MWAPLALKSHHTLDAGTASPAELVARLHADGLGAAALADVGTLSGQVAFHARCLEAGIRPIAGVEWPSHGSVRPGRVVLLARDRPGYERLCRFVTLARAAEPAPDAARLLEETGYEAEEWSPLITVRPEPARHDHWAHFFVARGARRTSEQDLDPSENVVDGALVAQPGVRPGGKTGGTRHRHHVPQPKGRLRRHGG
jgi:hypothetical protein